MTETRTPNIRFPGLTSLTEIEDMNHRPLTFGLKYRLGGTTQYDPIFGELVSLER